MADWQMLGMYPQPLWSVFEINWAFDFKQLKHLPGVPSISSRVNGAPSISVLLKGTPSMSTDRIGTPSRSTAFNGTPSTSRGAPSTSAFIFPTPSSTGYNERRGSSGAWQKWHTRKTDTNFVTRILKIFPAGSKMLVTGNWQKVNGNW